MQTIAERLEQFNKQRPASNILEEDECLEWLLEAVRKYDAYGSLEHHTIQRQQHAEALASGANPGPLALAAIDQQLPLSNSDWAVIDPLWKLYMERERALIIESGRGMGDVGFGRSSSEIAPDITMYENDLHMKAFSMAPFTI